jgi:tetratricopeptide (TPR) repeat protein
VSEAIPNSQETLLDILGKFPDQSLREFEAEAIRFCAFEGFDFDENLLPIASDKGLPIEIRFAAFFTLGTWMRRMKDSSRLLALIDTFYSEFQTIGSFHHLRAMAFTQRATGQDLEHAMASSEKALALLPNHVGIKHSYVVTRIVALEERLRSSPRPLTPIEQGQLDEAETKMADVISEEPMYARFYSSQARIHSLRGRHEKARQSLLRAIDLENSKSPDFSIRITEYNQFLFGISMREALSEVAEEVNKAQQVAGELGTDLKKFTSEAQTKYLELLGIFSAVIGLVLTSVQVSTNSSSFASGAGLMLVVSGAILVVFSAVGAIVNRSLKFILSIALLGGVLISLGFVAGFLIS